MHKSSAEALRAERLLRRHGRNALSWRILSPGMSLWFSEDGGAVIGYVREGNLRIVGGAPIAGVADLKRAAVEFERDARKNRERVCYLAAESWLKDALEPSEHRAVVLGAQPVWEPNRWRETLARKASLRELIRHSVRRGVTVEEMAAEAVRNSPEAMRCRESWLRGRKMPALGFLIRPDVFENSSGRRFFAARREGKIIGMACLAPMPGRNGWLVEHLFRAPGTLKGTHELLVDSVMRALETEGASCVTLGLAPLSRKAGISYGSNPWWLRIFFSALYSKASFFYGFSGLDAFKAKFMPHRWEPVYAIVDRPRFGASTLYGIARAFTGMPIVHFALLCLVRAGLGAADPAGE